MAILSIVRVLCIFIATVFFTEGATAQSFPSRPIRILVGFSAGGATDILARKYAEKLHGILGTPVIVENKPGAYELIATQTLLSSAADGHTLFLGSTGALIQAPLVRRMPYDPLKDFTHVARIAEVGAVLAVRKGFPVASFSELIDYAKANPGKVNYGSAGVGAPNHLLTEYISSSMGVEMAHIPYKSDSEVARELVAGTLDIAIINPSIMIPYVLEGKIKSIAVAYTERLKNLPDTPTLAESNPAKLGSVGVYSIYGIVGPAGMPEEVTRKLNDAFNQVAKMPDVIDLFNSLSIKLTTSTSADLTAYLEREKASWSKVAQSLDLKL